MIKFGEESVTPFYEHATCDTVLQTKDSLNALAKDKLTLAKSENNVSRPYIAAVGSVKEPAAFFVVFGEVFHETGTAVEALQFAIKLILTYNIGYPKASLNAWVLIQKIFLRLTVRGEKVSMHVKKALMVLEKTLDMSFYDI